MLFCDACCSPCAVVIGGENWSELNHEIVVEIEGSTTIGKFCSECETGPVAGGCCPCLDGTYVLSNSFGCGWAGSHFFNTTIGDPVKEECEEPYPCYPVIFPGICEPVTVGTIALTFGVTIDGNGLHFNLNVNQQYLRLGRGYVCGPVDRGISKTYPDYAGEPIDISGWIEMDDYSVFPNNAACGWCEWEDDDGVIHPPTVSVRFKAAA